MWHRPRREAEPQCANRSRRYTHRNLHSEANTVKKLEALGGILLTTCKFHQTPPSMSQIGP
jgi:hypothetical protein